MKTAERRYSKVIFVDFLASILFKGWKRTFYIPNIYSWGEELLNFHGRPLYAQRNFAHKSLWNEFLFQKLLENLYIEIYNVYHDIYYILMYMVKVSRSVLDIFRIFLRITKIEHRYKRPSSSMERMRICLSMEDLFKVF